LNQSLEPAFAAAPAPAPAPASASAFAPAPQPAPGPARGPGPERAGVAAASAPTDAEVRGGRDAPDAPAALADLVAAGLVSHEMIGDPARLRGEAATLRVLCAQVPGSIWRIEPYHYAFRLEPGLAGGLPGDGGLPATPETAAAALAARLAAELGADAAWVSATDLIASDEAASDHAATAGEPAVDLDAPLLLLRAGAAAVADGLACAGAGVQAVVSAGFAVRAARLAAGRIEGESGPAAPDLGRRLAALEAGQGRIEAALAAEAESRAAAAAAEVRLSELLAKVLRRLDAQADVLHGHIAREDQVAGRLGEIAALAGAAGGAAAGFQETLGLALAEFLARLERREAAASPETSSMASSMTSSMTAPATSQGPSRLPQLR